MIQALCAQPGPATIDTIIEAFTAVWFVATFPLVITLIRDMRRSGRDDDGS